MRIEFACYRLSRWGTRFCVFSVQIVAQLGNSASRSGKGLQPCNRARHFWAIRGMLAIVINQALFFDAQGTTTSHCYQLDSL